MNRIKVEISNFDSGNWTYIPKLIKPNDDELNDDDEKLERDIEGDPFPLHKRQSLYGFFSGSVKMDKQIIESGLRVLASKQEMISNMKLKTKSEISDDKITEVLKRLQELEGKIVKIDKIDHKLNQILNQKLCSN
jgi:CxxC motif-containing protein